MNARKRTWKKGFASKLEKSVVELKQKKYLFFLIRGVLCIEMTSLEKL